mmetsp:Transcript_18048/g.37023  ORF Transcript_18048/g.37023 Transcript_18048/m.37023 type:complete len:80 (+) Transcript_18048:197-436(+)
MGMGVVEARLLPTTEAANDDSKFIPVDLDWEIVCVWGSLISRHEGRIIDKRISIIIGYKSLGRDFLLFFGMVHFGRQEI